MDELAADLANQILVNSMICCTKAKRFKHALYVMSAAVIIWTIVLFMQFARQEEVVIGIAPATQSLSVPIKADALPTVQNVYFPNCSSPEKSSGSQTNRQSAH